MRINTQPRPAATLVESAVVLSALMIIIVGFLVMALGVFRYQQIAALAREGARYASVRGTRYEMATGNAAATPQQIYDNAILPKAVALDPSELTYSVTWSPDKRQGSLVTVRLSYHWLPEALFGSGTLTSTSSMRISY